MNAKHTTSVDPRRGTRPLVAGNLVAFFDKIEAARSAMTALSRAGIDGDDISLAGPGLASAEEEMETGATIEEDARMATWVAGGAVTGSVAGAVIGAILGIPIGLLGISITDAASVNLPNMLLAMGLAALTGSIAGAWIGYMATLQPSDQWDMTFHETEGSVLVAVHTGDEKTIETAKQVLRTQEAVDIFRVGNGGRLQTSPN
jgi:hypothetical protein